MDPNRRLNPKLSALFADDRPAALRIILPAIEASDGNLEGAARKLNISVHTLRRWKDKEPRIKKALDDARIAAIKAS